MACKAIFVLWLAYAERSAALVVELGRIVRDVLGDLEEMVIWIFGDVRIP